jgi:hypothetical protein
MVSIELCVALRRSAIIHRLPCFIGTVVPSVNEFECRFNRVCVGARARGLLSFVKPRCGNHLVFPYLLD